MEDDRRWACRGIRGAITTDGDGAEAVEAATKTLLEAIVEANGCLVEEVAAVIFTVPDELGTTNPSAAARKHGWSAVPLLAVREQAGDGGVQDCLRVLLLWNTTRSQAEIRHIYLRGARALRPDLSIPSMRGADT
ncbi:MAG: chorismate mutase [Actinomycetota bacterium]|nr:chorismate mutase [Actinomycetota bacterium]